MYIISNDADKQNRIIAILEKKQIETNYNKLDYITSVEELYDKKSDIGEYMMEEMKERLSYSRMGEEETTSSFLFRLMK